MFFSLTYDVLLEDSKYRQTPSYMGLSYTDSHIQTLYSVTNVSTHAIPCFHLCSMPGIGTIFSGTQAVATTRARPGRCPLAGPASRASGPAPTWRRWSGRATDRAGVGRRASPGGRWGGGDEGKGWGSCGAVSVAAAASRPASGETEGSRECPGCAPHDGVDAEGGSTLESEPSRPRSPSGS